MRDNVSVFRRMKRLLIFLVVTLVDFIARTALRKVKNNTLLLVRVDLIGDYVVFHNFIEILKKSEKYRDYKITLCGNTAWRDLAETFDNQYVNDFIWIDRRRLEKDLGYRFFTLRSIAGRGFQLAIQPTFSREFYYGDAIIKASRAPEKIGSSGDLSNSFRWQKFLADRYYTRLLPANPDNLFEFYRSKEFFEHLLGEQIALLKPILKIRNEQKKKFGTERFAVIFPGASSEAKKWNTYNFAEIARHLVDKHHLKVVIAGAPDDIHLAKHVIAGAPLGVIDISGKTTLTELAAVLASAELLVSNDTSAIHLALAVETQTICILTGSHFGRYAPYPPEVSERLTCIYPSEISDYLSNTKLLNDQYRNISSPLDINTISADSVKRAIDDLLGKRIA